MDKKSKNTQSTGKAKESSKPGKETIKQNSDKQNKEQSKKDTNAKRVERNFDKDQE